MIGRMKLALMLTVATPVKPGAVHRLVESVIVERRLAEAMLAVEVMDEAYKRGLELASGRRDSRSLELGRLIAGVYRRVFEIADVKPIYGLDAAAVILPALAGYAAGAKRSLRDALPQAITALLYRGGARDSIEFIEGLEAVGASDLIMALEDEGLTKRNVRLEDTPLGDVFERLSRIDKGFVLNIRGYSYVLNLAREAQRARSMAGAVLASYLRAAGEAGLIGGSQPRTLRDLVELDKRLRNRGVEADNLLGAVFAAAAIVAVERPDLPLV